MLLDHFPLQMKENNTSVCRDFEELEGNVIKRVGHMHAFTCLQKKGKED